MTITIDLAPELQAELARQAATHGRAIEASPYPRDAQARSDLVCKDAKGHNVYLYVSKKE
jgi:hypothetical protein